MNLSEIIRSDTPLSGFGRFALAVRLAVPAILAQISAVVMGYIDASMVGSLGADAAASIGLVATSTWLFNGLCSAGAVGFYVQTAHQLGAGRPEAARAILRQAMTSCLLYSLLLMAIGAGISGCLPHWLGGGPSIAPGASAYFLIFSLAAPALQFTFLLSGMLRCVGKMTVAGGIGIAECVLDVLFNAFLIFPARDVSVAGFDIRLPGADMGVEGAALGTALAMLCGCLAMWSYLFFKPSELQLRGERGSYLPRRHTLRRALSIATPMGLERLCTNAAQITLTVIVAPLGAAAIAANAFAVTAEGLCYMPGYGISDAATALVGQSVGAGKRHLARSFATLTVGMGIGVMTIMGAVMYVAAPAMIGFMTPDPEIVALGVEALRIEAWAEPMFAAAIVTYGVFVGTGDTFVPALMNLGSIWIVRVSLAAVLAPVMGLKGVWLAMCIELTFRGLIFLVRLARVFGRDVAKAAEKHKPGQA